MRRKTKETTNYRSCTYKQYFIAFPYCPNQKRRRTLLTDADTGGIIYSITAEACMRSPITSEVKKKTLDTSIPGTPLLIYTYADKTELTT